MDNVKILIVEDEMIIAMEIQDRVEGLGYEVLDMASSGEEALKIVRKETPDLILMDIMLKGGIDGVETATQIRQTLNVPIIYLTAYADNNTLQRAKITEPSGYILKPVNEKELQIAIEIGLYKHQMEKEGVAQKQAEALLERFSQLSSMALNNTRLYRTMQQKLVQQKRVEEALRLSEERYALAASAANNGLWDWDLQVDEIYFSPQWTALIGYEGEEIGSRPRDWFNRVHHDDLERLQKSLAAAIQGGSEHFENQHRLWHKDSTYRWMLSRGVPVRDETGKVTRIVGTLTDITHRKETEEQLVYEAFHDPLTGLPNRALFTNRLMRAISKSRQLHDYLFAVLFLDLDRFKLINDSLGHLAGDELLVGIAERLKECVRSADTVARMGGDEFTILLEDLKSQEDALIVAQRIQESLTEPFYICQQDLFASTSIGIVLGHARYEGAEDLLRDADTALYQAKKHGKARYEVFDVQMHDHARASLQLETELRQAIQQEEFRVHYLPIVSLKNGQVVGLEALARWQHPTRGLLLPVEFIAAAEESGLIIPLGEWVLRTACTELATWQAQFISHPPLTMSVNLSSKQLIQGQLVEQIPQILSEMHLNAQHLKVEIAERSLMEHVDAFDHTFSQLRALGVGLQLDDFSTRYLDYLHDFPLTTVKIDPSITHGTAMPEQHAQILDTIITLANRLGLKVIAEGVETMAQVNLLRDLRCDYAQGHFFSPALGSADTKTMLRQTMTEKRRIF